MNAARNARRFVRREVIARRIPHGLVSWRYLRRDLTGPLVRQRAVWRSCLPGVPRLVALGIELLLWVRWATWSGHIASARVVRRRGPGVRADEGIGLAVQLWRVWRLAIGSCIPPRESYRFALYRPDGRDRAHEYVYDHTAAAYHAWRNAGRPGRETAAHLLGDKLAFSRRMAAEGIPVVPVLAVLGKEARLRPDDALPGPAPLFVKPRRGSGGRGAFVVESVTPLSIRTLGGERLEGVDAESHWHAQLADGDLLVQPSLDVHPAARLPEDAHDIVTVRYVTEIGPNGITALAAMLELPAQPGEYTILPIGCEDGTVGLLPRGLLAPAARERYRAMEAIHAGTAVPGFEDIRRHSAAAHRVCIGARSVAWDWALTSRGPVLLEGNPGWGPAMPQMIGRGLLADPP